MNISLISSKISHDERVCRKLVKIVDDYIDNNVSFTYLTDLNTTYDRFFAELCRQRKLPIHIIFPHDKIVNLYKQLPHVVGQINDLTEYASMTQNLFTNGYSPKKHIKTQEFIIDKSSVVIVVHNRRLIVPHESLSGKTTINIYDDKERLV